ncbi:hypothetical protein S83_001192, partial [Arachis hypogaea]
GRRKHVTEKGALLAPLHLIVVVVGAAAGCAVAVELDGELKGFGQLHLRFQGVETLGTKYSSSIFPTRAPSGQLLLLNFIRGATNPGLLSKQRPFAGYLHPPVQESLHSSFREDLCPDGHGAFDVVDSTGSASDLDSMPLESDSALLSQSWKILPALYRRVA